MSDTGVPDTVYANVNVPSSVQSTATGDKRPSVKNSADMTACYEVSFL